MIFNLIYCIDTIGEFKLEDIHSPGPSGAKNTRFHIKSEFLSFRNKSYLEELINFNFV